MKKQVRLFLQVVGVLVICLLIYLAYAGGVTIYHARSIVRAVSRLDTLASTRRLTSNSQSGQALSSEVERIEEDLRAIERATRPMLRLADRLAWLSADVAAMPDLLHLGIELTAAARSALDLAAPLIQEMSEPSPAAQGTLLPRAVSLLEQHPELVASMTAHLDQAMASRRQVDAATLSPSLQERVAEIDRVLPALHAAAHLLPSVPTLLGENGPRIYLLLAQNNEELRATGGFISGVGELILKDGELFSLRFMDSYAVDNLSKSHPAPPPALARYMGADYLVLRDANWSPDFLTAASVISSLYQLDQGLAIDGIVAADLTALGYLLTALGPLQIEGYKETITAENYLEVMVSYWETPAGNLDFGDAEWWLHRKDFLGAVLGAAVQKILESPRVVDWIQLAIGLREALDEKHVLLFFDDEEIAATLRELGWDGAVLPTDGDYLMVIDSNIGFNKVNPLIEERLEYHVWLDTTPRAELQITYRHRGITHLTQCIQEARYGDSYADMRERCYWDYVRVYLPAGVVVRDVNGFSPGSVEPATQEASRLIVSGLVVLAPGQEHTVRITYELPRSVYAKGSYQLVVQKQAGTGALPISIVIEDMSCRAGLQSDSMGAVTAGSILRLNTDLRLDRQLDVRCPRREDGQ